jgi:hypothetical protein
MYFQITKASEWTKNNHSRVHTLHVVEEASLLQYRDVSVWDGGILGYARQGNRTIRIQLRA